MQAPGGPQEDPTGGFTLGGWTPPTSTKPSARPWARSSAGPSTCCWPQDLRHLRGALALRSDPNDPIAAAFNRVTKYGRVALQHEARLAEQPAAGPRQCRIAEDAEGPGRP